MVGSIHATAAYFLRRCSARSGHDDLVAGYWRAPRSYKAHPREAAGRNPRIADRNPVLAVAEFEALVSAADNAAATLLLGRALLPAVKRARWGAARPRGGPV